MKILLADLDCLNGFPNRALMCLSAWHKERGDSVQLVRREALQAYKYWPATEKPLLMFDRAYISCVFQKNSGEARQIADIMRKSSGNQVDVGGCGIEGTPRLPENVEHLMPDYDLYGVDFSMGYTSRGCFRRCGFCSVYRREGNIRDNAPVSEFWDRRHKKVLLMDNNLVASPRWRENLRFCEENGLKVSVTQGIDARLCTRSTAAALAKHWPFYNWKFNSTALYTAWDSVSDEATVLRGIENLIGAGVPAGKIMPYVLVSYESSLKEDLYRFDRLRGMGTTPFIMSYDNAPHPMKHWGNRPAAYKSCTFREWIEKRREAGRSIPREEEVDEVIGEPCPFDSFEAGLRERIEKINSLEFSASCEWPETLDRKDTATKELRRLLEGEKEGEE